MGLGRVEDRSVSGRRWWVCALLFGATALSFLDRQVLSVLAKEITAKLGMTDLDYAWVTNAFLVSYAVMFLLGGRVMDLVGTRLGMALSVGIWSVASALHAGVQSAFQLGACRFLLGAGEGGCFPGAAKGVAETFEPRERALATGIAIGGASLGAVLAPPLSTGLAEAITWRGVFAVTGALGAAWVAGWWLVTRRRSRAPAPAFEPVQAGAERAGLARSAAPDPSADPRPPILPYERPRAESAAPVPLSRLLGRADVWGLALMRFIFDPVFYFYMLWIPKYLGQERGLSQLRIGALAWIPFLALGVSNVIGGITSDALIKGGMPPARARRLIMAAAAALTVASAFAAHVGSVAAALAMMSFLMFAHGFWITNYVTLIGDRFPRGAVGTVMGFAGFIGALGGMCANTAIGWCVTRFSYAPVWVASGLLYPAAFAVLLMMVRDKGPEQTTAEAAEEARRP